MGQEKRGSPVPRFKYDVFLSHNGQDKPAVEQLALKLRAAGLDVNRIDDAGEFRRAAEGTG